MAKEFGDLRALARDRNQKAGAGGTYTAEVLLVPDLADELAKLEALRPEAPVPDGKKRLASPNPENRPAPPIDEELEAQIDELYKDIEQATLKIKFRTAATTTYQRLVNENPDTAYFDENGNRLTHQANWAKFMNAICDECLVDVIDGQGERWDSNWEKLCTETLSYGEWDVITQNVLALNRGVPSVPKSRPRSGKTR